MKNPFSYEEFLNILEHDDRYDINETSFWFDDDPEETDHMLGCIREYAKPYWIGYCDVPDGCEFYDAEELLTAKVFDGRSMKERWEHIVFSTIGGADAKGWLDYYSKKL